MSGLPSNARVPEVEPDPLLVRWGLGFFARLARELGPAVDEDGVHFLNDQERAALRRIEQRAVGKAALAGAVSTVVSATAEVLATPLLGPDHDHPTTAQSLAFWGVVGGVTIVASAIEILYLYWDGLSAVFRLTQAAGLDLFPEGDDAKLLAGAMARAALELPNPEAKLFGIDPRRESSKLRLLVASLAYKAKIGVTNFLVKALVRRMLGRAFVRSWLPFVAVPITALWNAAVCFLVVREARIRAMGPSAVRQLLDAAFARHPSPSAEARAVCVRAVASAIVHTEDMHPNHTAMLDEIVRHVGARLDRPRAALSADAIFGADLASVDDPARFLQALASLPPEARALPIEVLAIASIIDGRLTRKERALLGAARRATGLSATLDEVEALRRRFVTGAPLSA